jgi:hypothetical protein
MPNLQGIEAPIVRISLFFGNVVIRTADRPGFSVEAGPAIEATRSTGSLGDGERTFPILRGEIVGPNGPVILPAESFVSTSLPRGARDIVTFTGSGALNLTIPANTALLVVQVVRGSVSISDYRNGTFLTRVRNGAIRLNGVGGEGYVQILRGPAYIADSTFAHLRARSGLGPIVFERCRARQIEVASVDGAILYDAGVFEPGLARFESQNGTVAVGVSGGSQLGAHAGSGRVYTQFEGPARIQNRTRDTTAVVGSGGPVITANSANGNVYLFDGSVRSHANAADGWSGPQALLRSEAPAGRPPLYREGTEPQLRPAEPNAGTPAQPHRRGPHPPRSSHRTQR